MPTGTSSRFLSSTYTRVLQMEEPIGGLEEPDKDRLMVAQTVASVGPYALIILSPRDHLATDAPLSASPPFIRHCRGKALNSSRLASTGTGNKACVTPRETRSSYKARPSRCSCGKTSVAPALNAIRSSQNEASKFSEANCRTRDSSVSCRPSLWLVASEGIPSCVTTTPFGIPVDPEV